jgi:hypothetical protein
VKVNVEGITGPSGLDGLAASLDRAAAGATDEVRKVTQKGLLNIKTDWRQTWSGHRKIRPLPNTITYDSQQTADKVVGEVGPEHGRNGAELANLIEYEFGGIHSAPIPGGAPALEREKPRFERALSDLEVRLLEGRR